MTVEIIVIIYIFRDLEGLPTRTIRNAHDEVSNEPNRTIKCYLKSDIEQRCVYGCLCMYVYVCVCVYKREQDR